MLKKISFLFYFSLMLALTVNLASCVLVNSTSFQTDTNQAQKNLSKRKNSINTMYFLGDSLLDTGGFIEVIHSANEKLKKNSLIIKIKRFINDLLMKPGLI